MLTWVDLSYQTSVTGSFLKYGFHPNISQTRFFQYRKTSGLTVFHFICKYLSEKIQIIYWNNKRKSEKLLNPRICHEIFSEKTFEAAQQCNDMKRYQQWTISHSFCAYLHSFFSGKTRKSLDNCFNQNFIIGCILGNHFNVNLR